MATVDVKELKGCCQGYIEGLFSQHVSLQCNTQVDVTMETCDLFARQRRNGDRTKLVSESLIQPVKLFVPPRHLNIWKLQQHILQLQKTLWY